MQADATMTEPRATGATLPAIRGFLPSSLNEWRGRIACVLFLGGCNWRCSYCHGWRFVTESAEMPPVPFETVCAALRTNAGWIDGAVVSGGEPTLHPGLPALVAALRAEGLAVKLHSNGSRPAVLEALLRAGALDCLALDCKAPFTDERLSQVARVPALASDLGRSLTAGVAAGVEIELHTTLCPACLALEDLAELAREIHARAPESRWILQQYGPEDVLDPAAAGSRSYTGAELEAAVEPLRAIHSAIELRGI